MSRNIRDVAPVLQKVRNFLLGRPHTLALRFEDEVATRSPPPPVLPDGPSHRLNTNYYYSRDARREVSPPEIVAEAGRMMLSSGEGALAVKPVKQRAPGRVYQWD